MLAYESICNIWNKLLTFIIDVGVLYHVMKYNLWRAITFATISYAIEIDCR
jgi:hypothetical protein